MPSLSPTKVAEETEHLYFSNSQLYQSRAKGDKSAKINKRSVSMKLEAPVVENKGLQCVYSQCGHGNGIGD